MGDLDVDHKRSLDAGGSDRITNKQLLCGPCNSRKGNLNDGVFRRRYGLTPTRQAKGPPAKEISLDYFDKITKELAQKRAKVRRKNSEFRL